MYTVKLVRLGKTYTLDADNRWYLATNSPRKLTSLEHAETHLYFNVCVGHKMRGDYCYILGPKGGQYPVKAFCRHD